MRDNEKEHAGSEKGGGGGADKREGAHSRYQFFRCGKIGGGGGGGGGADKRWEALWRYSTVYAHKNTTCTLSCLTYVQLCHTQHTINAHMNTRAYIIWCQIMEKAMTWEGTNENLSLLLCLLTTLQS